MKLFRANVISAFLFVCCLIRFCAGTYATPPGYVAPGSPPGLGVRRRADHFPNTPSFHWTDAQTVPDYIGPWGAQTPQQCTDVNTPCLNGAWGPGACYPASSSVFFKKHHLTGQPVPWGYDGSDRRYTLPAIREPYGGVATKVYTHTSGAIIYIASRHIGLRDWDYCNCLEVKAFLDVGCKDPMEEDTFPWRMPGNHPDAPVAGRTWTVPNWNARTEPGFSGLPQLQMPESYVGSEISRTHPNRIDDFLETQLTAGKNVLVYDYDEEGGSESTIFDHGGCRGAAAAILSYIMYKESKTLQAAYDEMLAKRPCIEQLYKYKNQRQKELWLDPLIHISNRRLFEVESAQFARGRAEFGEDDSGLNVRQAEFGEDDSGLNGTEADAW